MVEEALRFPPVFALGLVSLKDEASSGPTVVSSVSVSSMVEEPSREGSSIMGVSGKDDSVRDVSVVSGGEEMLGVVSREDIL